METETRYVCSFCGERSNSAEDIERHENAHVATGPLEWAAADQWSMHREAPQYIYAKARDGRIFTYALTFDHPVSVYEQKLFSREPGGSRWDKLRWFPPFKRSARFQSAEGDGHE